MKIVNMQENEYVGIANPSGAVALNNHLLIVADDEDNKLRIYDRNVVERPLQTIALSSVFKGQIADGDDMEIDLESATEIKGTYFWIGSHSTSAKGEFRQARHRLIAVNIKPGANEKFKVTPVGQIYASLIEDLKRDSRFDDWNLGKATKIQAKALNGLSIEGLAATAKNSLLIGFRNPLSGGKVKKDRLVNGRALVVELLNPFEVIHGLKAKFSDPIELDLGGFGIREITQRKKNKYLIVAGPYHENRETEKQKKEVSRLYQWSRKSGKLNHLKKVDLSQYNIEAAVFYPENQDFVQLLSDDGVLKDAKSFRSLALNL